MRMLIHLTLDSILVGDLHVCGLDKSIMKDKDLIMVVFSHLQSHDNLLLNPWRTDGPRVTKCMPNVYPRSKA